LAKTENTAIIDADLRDPEKILAHPAARRLVDFSQPAGLLIRRTNLSALNFDLYQLDEAAVIRTARFREGDWALFQPERYSQPLLRSWSVPLADPLNQPVEERVPLATSMGDPLAAGAYYLRIRTPEGPRADLLTLISRARLTLQSSAPVSGTAALVWATDIISGTPLAGLETALEVAASQPREPDEYQRATHELQRSRNSCR
jgi:hypothetical protein